MKTVKDFIYLVNNHVKDREFNIPEYQLKKIKWYPNTIVNFVKALEIVRKEKRVTFPFKKYYMKKPEYYYNNLLNYKPKIVTEQPYDIYRNIISETGKFKDMYYVPLKNKQYLYIGVNPDDYETINILPDYYTEKPRIESTGHGEVISPDQFWRYCMTKILLGIVNKELDFNTLNLRREVYLNIKEARQGKTTVYFAMYRHFKAKHILDIASAWGDRLIAAIATPEVESYLGIDPNQDLITGHNRIIDMFADDKCKYQMIYKPFEQAQLPLGKKYDFVFFSPPPFYGDVYGNVEGQSITSFPEFDDWFVNFMLFSCYKAYKHLDCKGWFFITVLDRLYPEKYAIVELLNLSMEYKCKYLHYRGVVGWQGDNKSITPCWGWKLSKKDPIEKVGRAQQLLEKYYPKIFPKIRDINYKQMLTGKINASTV